MFESEAMRASAWEKASDVVHPEKSKFLDARQIATATGLPQYIFTHLRVRESLGVSRRRISRQIRFDLDEVMASAKRWSQDMENLGIDTRDPATEHRTLQQAIASLVAWSIFSTQRGARLLLGSFDIIVLQATLCPKTNCNFRTLILSWYGIGNNFRTVPLA